MDKLKQFLDKYNFEYYENFEVNKISTIRLGENLKLTIFPHSKEELKKLLTFCYKSKIFYRVFGNLSNVLFIENINFPVIITNKMQMELQRQANLVTVSAGLSISKFYEYLKKNELSGIEPLTGIPATVGGAIFSNAGAFGSSISDYLVSIEVFCEGKCFILNKNEINFGYHYSSLYGFIVLSATFLFENKKEYDIMNLFNEFTYKRNKTQPSGFSLGSVYKKANDNSAGFYIERSGLKGTKIGGIFVSSKHANFFINDGSGSVSDFLRLENLISNEVLNQFGITLYTEIEKVGNRDEIISGFTHSFKV